MSRVLDFEVTTDIDNIPDGAVCIVEYTKSKDEEEKQADEILSHGLPCAIISNEAPGRNKNGYYHNAVVGNFCDLFVHNRYIFIIFDFICYIL